MRHPPLKRVLFTIAAGTVAVGALWLTGDTSVHQSPASLPATSEWAPGSAGLRAFIDPETGRLATGPAPAAEQLDPETENAVRRDATGLTEEHRADGTVLVDLQGRFQSVVMVHRTADGRNVICVDDDSGAEKALHGEIATRPLPEVK